MSKHHEISNPSWYTEGRKFQPIDVILDWFPGDYLLGTVQKYLSRVGRKKDPIEDLRKARFYLDKKIESLQRLRDGSAVPLNLPDPDE